MVWDVTYPNRVSFVEQEAASSKEVREEFDRILHLFGGERAPWQESVGLVTFFRG